MEPVLSSEPPLRAGYGWPVVGIILWAVNLGLVGAYPALGWLALLGHLALMGAGLTAMYSRRLPATEAGRLIRVTQTVALLATVLTSLHLLEATLKLLAK